MSSVSRCHNILSHCTLQPPRRVPAPSRATACAPRPPDGRRTRWHWPSDNSAFTQCHIETQIIFRRHICYLFIRPELVAALASREPQSDQKRDSPHVPFSYSLDMLSCREIPICGIMFQLQRGAISSGMRIGCHKELARALVYGRIRCI